MVYEDKLEIPVERFRAVHRSAIVEGYWESCSMSREIKKETVWFAHGRGTVWEARVSRTPRRVGGEKNLSSRNRSWGRDTEEKTACRSTSPISGHKGSDRVGACPGRSSKIGRSSHVACKRDRRDEYVNQSHSLWQHPRTYSSIRL